MQFALCPLDGNGSRPPLGWSLSVATKQRIRADVERLHGAEEIAGDTCRARNQKAMRDLMALLPQPAQRQDAGAAQTAAPL